MTFSLRSIRSVTVLVIIRARMLKEAAVSVAAMSSMFEALASFSRQARGSIFYNVPLSEIKEGLKFHCELEPFNAREENSIVLRV